MTSFVFLTGGAHGQRSKKQQPIRPSPTHLADPLAIVARLGFETLRLRLKIVQPSNFDKDPEARSESRNVAISR